MTPLSKMFGSRDVRQQEPIGAALVSLAKDSAVYMAGALLIGLGSVVLVPLYTRTLSPREFGIYSLLDVTILLTVGVSVLKFDVSYLRWFADLNFERHGELLGSTLLAVLISSSLSGLGLWVLAMSPAGGLWLHSSAITYGWMLFPIVVLESLQALLLTDLRARRRSVVYSGCGIVRLITIVLTSYYLLAVRHSGLEGLFLGRLAGDVAADVFLIGASLRLVEWRLSISLLGPMIRFGLPLIWSVCAVMLQDALGRYFLSRHGTLEEVGVLGAAVKVGAVFQILVAQPFGLAWGGVLFQLVKERNAHMIYSRIFMYVYVLATSTSLVLAIFAPTLFRVFTAPAYYPAVAVLPLVLLVRAMSMIEQPASTGIYLAGRTNLLGLGYTAGLAANLVLLALLGPRYGLMGVSWAWFIASSVPAALFLFFGQQVYRLSLNTKLITLPLLAWIPMLLHSPGKLSAIVTNHFAIQCTLGVTIMVLVGLLIVMDVKALKRHLDSGNHVMGACSR